MGLCFFAPCKGHSREISNVDSLSNVISECLLTNKISTVTIANFVDMYGNETQEANTVIEKIKDKLSSIGVEGMVSTVLELYWEVYRLKEDATTLMSRFHLSKATGVQAVIVGMVGTFATGIEVKLEILDAKSTRKLASWVVRDKVSADL